MNNQTEDDSISELREFAYTMSAALVGIFCIAAPLLLHRNIPLWPILITLILLLQAFFLPFSLVPVRFIWLRIGSILGWINTRIILALVFFIVLTPIGYIQRKRGKLYYKVGYDRNADSYKIKRTQRLTKQDLENPF